MDGDGGHPKKKGTKSERQQARTLGKFLAGGASASIKPASASASIAPVSTFTCPSTASVAAPSKPTPSKPVPAKSRLRLANKGQASKRARTDDNTTDGKVAAPSVRRLGGDEAGAALVAVLDNVFPTLPSDRHTALFSERTVSIPQSDEADDIRQWLREWWGRWCLGEAEFDLPQPPLHTKRQARHLEAAATQALSRACRFPGSRTGSQRMVATAVHTNTLSIPHTAETEEKLRNQPMACESVDQDSGDIMWLQAAHTTSPFGALRGRLGSVAATPSFTQERTAGIATHAHDEGARTGAARPRSAELPGGSPARRASAALATHGAWAAEEAPTVVHSLMRTIPSDAMARATLYPILPSGSPASRVRLVYPR